MTASIIPKKASFVHCFILAALALSIAALGLGGCGGNSEKASSKDGTAAGDPSPTAVPLDIALAAAYERNGQYDEATSIYQALVSDGTTADRQQARLALARLYLAQEEYQQARDLLEAYESESGANTESAFLLARSLAGLGEYEQALAMYQRYIDDGGVAVPNARSQMADLLLSLGRLDEAQQIEDDALKALPESLRPGIILAMAQSLQTADAPSAALTWYERLFDISESDFDKAFALAQEATLKRQLGLSGWQADLQEIIAVYPLAAAAPDALDELLKADEPVDPYVEGLVYYRHLQNQDALDAFNRYLQADPRGSHAAAAHYYIAAIDERLDDNDAAIAEYAKSLEIDSTGLFAADVLWWRGLLLEKQSRFDEASTAYQQIQDLPSSARAGDAAFREGLLLYEQKQYQQAADKWRSLAETALDSDVAARALLWAAKAELASGDANLGKADLQKLAAASPLDYYGLRAATLLAENSGRRATPIATPGNTDIDATDWLANVTGDAPVPTFRITLDPRWSKGRELLAVGFPRSGAAELRDLMWANAGDPMALLALARAANWLGQTEISSRSAQLILEKLSPEQRNAAPREIMSLAYPQDYMALLASAQDSEGVSTDQMLALIRQESFFDPLAGSAAGALGLTQVIAPTAQEIATDLGISDFDSSQLARPALSIRFGAHYLEKQLAAFDHNLYYALAAYNGGPGAIDRWRAAAGDDIDLFLEQIDYSEANLYVRRVMENLAVYRYLYEGQAAPSLPQ